MIHLGIDGRENRLYASVAFVIFIRKTHYLFYPRSKLGSRNSFLFVFTPFRTFSRFMNAYSLGVIHLGVNLTPPTFQFWD